MISAHLRESRLCAPPYVERSPPSTFSFFKSNFASEPRQTGPRPDRIGDIIYLFIVACTPFILRLWACLLCHATTQPHHPPVYALPYDRTPELPHHTPATCTAPPHARTQTHTPYIRTTYPPPYAATRIDSRRPHGTGAHIAGSVAMGMAYQANGYHRDRVCLGWRPGGGPGRGRVVCVVHLVAEYHSGHGMGSGRGESARRARAWVCLCGGGTYGGHWRAVELGPFGGGTGAVVRLDPWALPSRLFKTRKAAPRMGLAAVFSEGKGRTATGRNYAPARDGGTVGRERRTQKSPLKAGRGLAGL